MVTWLLSDVLVQALAYRKPGTGTRSDLILPNED